MIEEDTTVEAEVEVNVKWAKRKKAIEVKENLTDDDDDDDDG